MLQDPVSTAQIILAGSGAAIGNSLVEAIGDIATHQLWLTGPAGNGTTFATFGELARATRPSGLQVNELPTFRLVRFALLENKQYGCLADLIDVCARQPGRPVESVAKDEHFRFYTVPTSYNSIDRILLTLKRNHEPLLESVRRKHLSPRGAAIIAGILVPRATALRAGACDLEKARSLPRKVQGDLLCDIFKTLSLDAQCALLSRCVEPVLGPDLARQRRNKGGMGTDHE